MISDVFTYGSLMFPPVWERVVRGHYADSNAILRGHARFTVGGQAYPGIVTQPDAQVEGVLYRGVTAGDLLLLDAFEGQEYRRIAVELRLSDGTAAQAWTYLYIAQDLSDSPWDPEAFAMQRFLDTYCADLHSD
jgi:gamma-glutamylcyclotransferase (GGCT)/AIG2-like uncharacterized protein YtfP